MLRSRAKELCEQRGLTLAKLQLKALLPLTTARKLWFSTADGLEGGPPLERVKLDDLERVCKLLQCTLDELFEQVPDT